MPLESGRQLGAFEILGAIGAGGMGEVYRAKDTRLDRTVALKVLPTELSANPALRERLQSHEAEAFLPTPFSERNPVLSPDGRWLLYVSNESGGGQVYVQSLLDAADRWPISIEGGRRATWTRDGREIVFQAPTGSSWPSKSLSSPPSPQGSPKCSSTRGRVEQPPVRRDGRRQPFPRR